jgi:allantoinase
MIVFAPEKEFVVTEGRLHYRHRVSPYLGECLRGEVQKTFVRGQCVFDDGEFPGEVCRKEVIRHPTVLRG